MTIFYDPIPKFFKQGDVANDGGSVEFFKSGTSTQLDTYADSLLTIKNTNPVLLDAAGYTVKPIYTDGSSAKIVVKDSNGVLLAERDPVGGEAVSGELAVWDAQVIYVTNALVKGSDGAFYISLSSGNVNNDPTSSPTNWSEVRFIGVWNTLETYAIGNVVQTGDGNLWASQISSNLGNNPTTDAGTNWKPAFDDLWINKSVSFSIAENKKYQIDAAAPVDAALPASATIGAIITVHNASTSTAKVRLTNTSLTIKGPTGTVTTADNLELDAGDTAKLVAITSTILEVV